MSVEPIKNLSNVISKKSGMSFIVVHPDGKELPEQFEYVKPKQSAGISINYTSLIKKKVVFNTSHVKYILS